MLIFIYLSSILVTSISEHFHDCLSTVPRLYGYGVKMMKKIHVTCLYLTHTNILSKDFTIKKSVLITLKLQIYLPATKSHLLKNNKANT